MAAAGPLSGITILDLTRVLAGPYCTLVLADLGARVIKVEAPGRGDDSRAYGPFVNGRSAYFMAMNRGKESIALDLKAAADRAVFERLLDRADVLVENFRGGTMERLGYGWDVLHARHPRLIYAAASGFGHTGPYAAKPAYDMVLQGMGGIMSITCQPGGPPTRVGASIGDITAGLFTAVGVAAALHHRNASGAGLKIDVAMLDCQVAILENAISRYFVTGTSPAPLGARHPSIAPFAAFGKKDGHIIVAAGTDAPLRRAGRLHRRAHGRRRRGFRRDRFGGGRRAGGRIDGRQVRGRGRCAGHVGQPELELRHGELRRGPERRCHLRQHRFRLGYLAIHGRRALGGLPASRAARGSSRLQWREHLQSSGCADGSESATRSPRRRSVHVSRADLQRIRRARLGRLSAARELWRRVVRQDQERDGAGTTVFLQAVHGPSGFDLG